MTYKVQLDERAKFELEEAVEWYSNKSTPLAKRFLDNTLDCLVSLQTSPKRFAFRYDFIRIAIIKRFPFAIHYLVLDDLEMVLVLAILHTSKNPKTWPK